MVAGMKHAREDLVSLALSLSTDSSTTTDSSGEPAPAPKKARRGRQAPLVATSGEGDFVCKTCSRAFTSFQALGGHRTSHLRGRHGLELGFGVARAIRERQRKDKQQHECHICGLGFEMGQALGGHMRRHREEASGGVAHSADAWVWRSVALPEQEVVGHAADKPPVLLELFV